MSSGYLRSFLIMFIQSHSPTESHYMTNPRYLQAEKPMLISSLKTEGNKQTYFWQVREFSLFRATESWINSQTFVTQIDDYLTDIKSVL